jgi:hypothetical protein
MMEGMLLLIQLIYPARMHRPFRSYTAETLIEPQIEGKTRELSYI